MEMDPLRPFLPSPLPHPPTYPIAFTHFEVMVFKGSNRVPNRWKKAERLQQFSFAGFSMLTSIFPLLVRQKICARKTIPFPTKFRVWKKNPNGICEMFRSGLTLPNGAHGSRTIALTTSRILSLALLI